MKIFKIVAFVLLFAHIAGMVTYANNSCNWYIKKNGNNTPGFPANAEFVSEHNGYFIDKSAADSGEKIIYLTFDAGYENGNIEKILDIMKAENVTAAFFVLSNLIKKNPELIRRMANEGHLVCNHTSNHKDMTRLSKEEMLANLSRLESQYKECTGLDMEKIFRFPEGRYNEECILTCEEAGYKTVFWSMAYEDWDNCKQLSSKKAMQKLLDTTHCGAILLLHPTSKTNAEILGDLIREWKSQGYSFGSLSDLK